MTIQNIHLPRIILQAGLLFRLLLPSAAQDPGFFLDDWEQRSAVIPESEPVVKTSKTPTVQVHVDMDSVLCKIPPYIFGNNAVTWGSELPGNQTAMTDLKNLNPRVLRWPGGSLSNEYFWNLSPGEHPDDIPASISIWPGTDTEYWRLSTDEYYDMLEETNATGLISVNYSYARYGLSADPVAAAAHLAAEWVRYDNGRTRFWDIGNEHFGSWEKGFEIDTALNQDGQPFRLNGQLYGQHCKVYMDSMRAAAAEVGNDIKIGVVTYDSEDSWTPNEANWNEEMMPEVAHLADYLIVHSYFTPWQENSGVTTILNSALSEPERVMEVVRSDMAEAGQNMIPVVMDEWNTRAINSKQQVSYINGMHAALVLGQFALKGYGLAARWDLVNGWDNGEDHGMFASQDEPGVDPLNPHAAFFYMYYWQRFMGDRMVLSQVDGSDYVTVYASSFSSGEGGLVLVNRGNTPQVVEVEFSNYLPGNRYYWYTLTGGSDNGDFSRKVYINGTGTDEQGGGPDEYASLKAASASASGGILLELPARGTVYLMTEEIALEVESAAVTYPGKVDIHFNLPADPGSTLEGFTIVSNGMDTLTVSAAELNAGGDTLTLTLEESIGPLDVITLSYGGEGIHTTEGKILMIFDDFPVNNNLPGSPPAVTHLYTDEEGEMVKVAFNKEMITGMTLPGDFVLRAGTGEGFTIAPDSLVLEPSGFVIRIFMEEPIFSEYELALTYTGNQLRSADGGILATFGPLPVENHAPGMPPVVTSAVVGNKGRTLQVTFSKIMNPLEGLAGSFNVYVDGTAGEISGIASSDSVMTISLEESILFYQQVTLSYAGTGASSADRGVLQEFADLPVENNQETPPIFPIPGTVDAEQYMSVSGMLLVDCLDEGGGKNLTSVDMGDYVVYMIDVNWAGPYRGLIRTAAPLYTGSLAIQTPDALVKEHPPIEIPVTGGIQEWVSAPVHLTLEEGLQRLVLEAQNSGFNINWLSLEPDTATVVSKQYKEEIRLYPNPTHGNVVLESGGSFIHSIQVTDLDGRVVLTVRPERPAGTLKLEIPLPVGMYLVKIHTGEGIRVLHLMVA